jgi:hypothetical protein
MSAWLERLKDSRYHGWYLALIVLMSSLVLYLPFQKDLSILFRYWDGPNYLYIAKTLYQIPPDHPFTPYQTTQAYFACHLPFYPLAIRALSFLGYPAAMIVTTLLFTFLATWMFYKLLQESQAVQSPFWSAVVALFLPARWLIYHSVGATEAPFLFLVFASMRLYLKDKYLFAFLVAGLATTTRIVGVLLPLAYLFTLIRERKWKPIPLLAVTPLFLLATFSFYQAQFGDFWAYFSWNSKLLHLKPTEVLLTYASNNLPHHAELYLIQYAVYGLGALLLWRFPIFFFYSILLWAFNLFIFHEDISRYFLVLTPFALIVAYDQLISTRAFKLIFPLILVWVYLYSWKLLPLNLLVPHVWLDLLRALQQ